MLLFGFQRRLRVSSRPPSSLSSASGLPMLSPVCVAAFVPSPCSLPYSPVSVAYSNATGWAAVGSLGDHAARRRHRDNRPGTVALVAVCMPAGLAMRGGSGSAIGVQACGLCRAACVVRRPGACTCVPRGVTHATTGWGGRAPHNHSRENKKNVKQTRRRVSHTQKKTRRRANVAPRLGTQRVPQRPRRGGRGGHAVPAATSGAVRAVRVCAGAGAVRLFGWRWEGLAHGGSGGVWAKAPEQKHAQGNADHAGEGRGGGGLGPSTTRALF